MNRPLRIVSLTGIVFAVALALGCERPPMDVEQSGFRGLGLEHVENPRLAAETRAANVLPEVVPPVPPSDIPASQAFRNVQVLGDLNQNEFSRLMVAITNWVSPKEGCTYCHQGPLDSDAAYPKVVARRMLQMVKEVNTNWTDHVGNTGVTCWTCHRGNPVPQYTWSTAPDPVRAINAGSKAGQNMPAQTVGLTSLPFDPFTPYLQGDHEIRVQSQTALPVADRHSIKEAEWTYGLMVHISDSLGVNCGHCHNTRSFMPWEASSPARVTAWHAIRMVRGLNNQYVTPLADVIPANHKGPLGDPLKVNCATCHQGVAKPLYGAKMLADYPELTKVTPTP